VELLRGIRGSEEKDYVGPDAFLENAEVDLLVENLENSVTSALKGKMVKDLVSKKIEAHHSIKPVPIGATK
jgi:hypothetical protein